ncbi:MAG TPA: multiubiquitin domain-containing protein [Verrucomicrobiales bacterium]|jgi:hypothetical protein|nr:multiubiquitin domain-containing protein [Verrucomicrobiales bacterium]
MKQDQITTDIPQHGDQEDFEDIELCSREGRKPRCVHKYRIKIDDRYHIVPVSFMTGLQIVELAGACNPGKTKLRQKFADGKAVTIGPNQKVEFTTPGVECFFTLPCDQTDG